MIVYLAAPLFSENERSFNLGMCTVLEHVCTVHLPQRDGPLVEKAIAGGVDPVLASRQAYISDIAAIRSCDVLVAVLDGRALDEGVCVELGFAKALGKKIVGFKSDARRVLPWGNNPIIDGCVDTWTSSFSDLAACLADLQSRGSAGSGGVGRAVSDRT